MIIAIVAALLNVVLSIVVPPLLKKVDNVPLTQQLIEYYKCNRNFIMASTISVLAFVYVSLEISPWVNDKVFHRLALLSNLSKE